MSKERLYIFDTTLRDGAQTQGVHFSIDEKTKIAHALDNLGVDYIEGGWPGANPSDGKRLPVQGHLVERQGLPAALVAPHHTHHKVAALFDRPLLGEHHLQSPIQIAEIGLIDLRSMESSYRPVHTETQC